MARKVKCPYCGEYLEKEEAVQNGKQYFHEECLKEKTRNAEDRKELIEYICNLYKLEAPTGMILKQIKEFQEQFNYKLKGMTLALQYFYETLGNSVREGDGIGIVPYVYEDAKKNYIMKMKVESSIENLETQTQTRVFEVVSPQFSYKRHIKHIDMNSL